MIIHPGRINIGIISVLYNHDPQLVYNWFEQLLSNFHYLDQYEITIYLINNGTVDYTFEKYDYSIISKTYPNIIPYHIEYHKIESNLGYCGGNNRALQYLNSKNTAIYIINPDLYIYNSLVFDWLYSLTIQENAITGILQDGKNWVVYPAMFPTDKKYDPEELPFVYNEDPRKKYPKQNWKMLPYIDGSLMCIPVEVYKNITFDIDFMPGYYGENAFQFRAKLMYNTKLLNCPIKKMIIHKNDSDSQYGIEQKIKWAKDARQLFYKKYALENYDLFQSLLV